jgi:hypothetical protein
MTLDEADGLVLHEEGMAEFRRKDNRMNFPEHIGALFALGAVEIDPNQKFSSSSYLSHQPAFVSSPSGISHRSLDQSPVCFVWSYVFFKQVCGL